MIAPKRVAKKSLTETKKGILLVRLFSKGFIDSGGTGSALYFVRRECA